MFSDNENLKKFVKYKPSIEEKLAMLEHIRKMQANSLYGAYVPNQFKLCVECPERIVNITADINQNAEDVF